MKVTKFHSNLGAVREATKYDQHILEIRKALEEGTKEMKGVALGRCQWEEGSMRYQGKIWIPEDDKLRTDIIRRNHDSMSAGHGGTAKTTELISRRYFWPGMRETIKRYVKNCDTCQRTKVIRPGPYG